MDTPSAPSRVSIEGLFGRHALEIDLFGQGDQESDPSRLRILFDDNGRGKTTVLRAVYHLMSWIDVSTHGVSLAEMPVESVVLDFLTGASLEFRRDPQDPALCILGAASSDGQIQELRYDAGRVDPRRRGGVPMDARAVQAYRDMAEAICLPPIFVADDRTVRSDALDRPRSTRTRQALGMPRQEVGQLDEWGVDPSRELGLLLDRLSVLFRRETFGVRRQASNAVYADVVKRITQSDLEAEGDVDKMRARAADLREGLSLAAEYNLVDTSQLDEVIETLGGLRRNSRRRDLVETVLDPFFTNLEGERERLSDGVGRIHLFVSTVNGFLQDKSLTYSTSDGLVISADADDEPEGLVPPQLSSGERHLLLLLSSAMLADSERLILIDEPELSLGIRWKRRLLTALLELTAESGANFLLASHSVEIITPYRGAARRLRGVDGVDD